MIFCDLFLVSVLFLDLLDDLSDEWDGAVQHLHLNTVAQADTLVITKCRSIDYDEKLKEKRKEKRESNSIRQPQPHNNLHTQERQVRSSLGGGHRTELLIFPQEQAGRNRKRPRAQ